LILVLVQKRETRLLPALSLDYERSLDEYRGIEKAEVISAVAMSQAEQARLTAFLQAFRGKRLF